MFFIIAAILMVFQAALIISTKFTFWPEILTFSWLVGKGLIPYKDFFDHHGFLLYYLAAPFVHGRDLTGLKIFFLGVQSINLCIVLLIIKKTDKVIFFLGGLLFVLLNYFMSLNILWYEEIITTFLLLTYYFLLRPKSMASMIATGGLITLASFIKPTAAVFILPAIMFSESYIPLIIIICFWTAVAAYYYFIGGLQDVVNDVFIFNSYLARNYHNPYYSDFKFHLSIAAVSAVLIALCIRAKQFRVILRPLFWMLLSIVFIFSMYNRQHLVPFISFFTVFLIDVVSLIQKKLRFLAITFLMAYILLIAGKVAYEHQNINSKSTLQERVNINMLPQTRYPVSFPLLDSFLRKKKYTL